MNKIIEKKIPANGKWSGVIKKGKNIKFTAKGSGANLSVLIYNANDLSERYNMPDTLKAQYTSKLTKGNVLMSDIGRVLVSIVEDSLGWNDTISGLTTKKSIEEKYGIKDYQQYRNERYTNSYDNFSTELIRNSLNIRDLVPPVNFFSKVQCDDQGDMNFVLDHCKNGDFVTLRTEMDCLVILSNTPNPLDSNSNYVSVPVFMEIFDAEEIKDDDYCMNFRDENKRAFENTKEYNSLI